MSRLINRESHRIHLSKPKKEFQRIRFKYRGSPYRAIAHRREIVLLRKCSDGTKIPGSEAHFRKFRRLVRNTLYTYIGLYFKGQLVKLIKLIGGAATESVHRSTKTFKRLADNNRNNKFMEVPL